MSSTSGRREGGDGEGGGDGGGGGGRGGDGTASSHRAAQGVMSSSIGSRGGGDGGEAGRGGGAGRASGHRDPTQAEIHDGGDGGVGVEGGGGNLPGGHSVQQAIPEPIRFVEGRVEAYDGENEELDMLETLASVLQEQPSLDSVLKDELAVSTEMMHVEQYGNQLGPEDLQACLRQGEWTRALDILTEMVQHGVAAGNAVNVEANLLDIRRTHPELVLLLRGQALFDLRRMGDEIRADSYHRNYICADYPEDSSTSIEFVDQLLAEIQAMAQSETLPRKCRFNDRKKTCRSVNDYLKIYFPSFRDVETEDGAVPLGIFGERKGKEVRCLVCHDFKKKNFSEKKLYYHQLRDREGRQALCPASTDYIQKEIRDVLAKKEAATILNPPPQDGSPEP